MNTNFNIAIIGATGLVGRTLLKILEEKSYSNCSYTLFASKKSAGSKLFFLGQYYVIQELTETSFNSKFDFAIFCAGSSISEKYIPLAVNTGCIVIDNSSFFRMNPNVPLVVPEVNSDQIFNHHGVIANPNCSTIQAVVALKPLELNYGIKRVVYSTYQAVSGAGINGIIDLENGYKNLPNKKFVHPIFNNCLPHIDNFTSDGYTKEEYKMINETRKILNRPTLPVTATCVRVPIKNCHCESINVELKNNFDIYDIKALLQNSSGIILVDDIEKNHYPLPSKVDGCNEVFIGRIRRDTSVPYGLNLWVVADNLRKGAAFNAVQILEKLIT